MVPGDRNLIAARCRLIKNFNYARVGTIKQSDEPYYSLVMFKSNILIFKILIKKI